MEPDTLSSVRANGTALVSWWQVNVSLLYPRVLRDRLAAGLFILRAMVAMTVVCRHPTSHLLESGAALLLAVGVWTPAAAAFIVIAELWHVASGADPWVSALLAAMTLTVALIGPGAWSAEARFFGWRRVEIPLTRKSQANTQDRDSDAP